jgi:peptidoglycan/LPS O-acetylase OafA/YrhL
VRTAGWFLVVVGLAIAGVWTLLLGSGQVPEVSDGRVDIIFHIVAEALTATLLVAAGAGLLRGWPRAPLLAAVAIGALAYTAVNSAGYYAESGDWPAVTMFAVLAVGTALAAWRVLRRDRPGERREVPDPDPVGAQRP